MFAFLWKWKFYESESSSDSLWEANICANPRNKIPIYRSCVTILVTILDAISWLLKYSWNVQVRYRRSPDRPHRLLLLCGDRTTILYEYSFFFSRVHKIAKCDCQSHNTSVTRKSRILRDKSSWKFWQYVEKSDEKIQVYLKSNQNNGCCSAELCQFRMISPNSS